jgi:photosystem II stability/assembly factor-like uncharacterized protein
MTMRFVLLLFLSTAAFAQWQPQQSHTSENLRGVGILDRNHIWASGAHGTYLVTKDGGKNWDVGKVPGAGDLDFRGVKAFQKDVFLLAAGPGDKSRIYHLRRGGKWELQFTNPEHDGFFDCMAFFDEQRGIVVGDPVGGKLRILRTDNGGKSWQFADPAKTPPAIDGEGSFAASNTCITTHGNQDAWFATGGTVARVFHSSDGGESWTVSDTPIVHGTASQGIFSIAFRDSLHGVVAGGDYKNPEQTGPHLATTDDGGKTWKLAEITPQKFFSAVAFVGGPHPGLIVVGSNTTAFSADGLKTWNYSLSEGFNTVEAKQGVIFAVGPNGKLGWFFDVARTRR